MGLVEFLRLLDYRLVQVSYLILECVCAFFKFILCRVSLLVEVAELLLEPDDMLDAMVLNFSDGSISALE